MPSLQSRLSGEIFPKSTAAKQHLYHLTRFSMRFWECTRYFRVRTGRVSSTWPPTFNPNTMLDGSPPYFLSGGLFWATVGSRLQEICDES